LAAAKTPTSAAEPPEQEWEVPVAVPKDVAQGSKRNVAVDKSVAQEFLDKIKLQLLSEATAAKFKEDNDTGWRWSLTAKTWTAGYWVGVRQAKLLSPNVCKEMLAQLQTVMNKRRSGWKNSFFVAIFAFDALQEGDTVLKLCRGFANREENSTTRNLVNLVVMDLNQRRLVLCGKKTSDLNHGAILRALGV
jgi:hypothetical protein